MRVLGIETATTTGGVALTEDDRLVAELRLNVRVTHSERLLPGLAHVLKQAGMSIADVDVLAVSIGPGSFTGLRVGLGMVKGLAFATGKPVAAVPTLEALAWNLPYSSLPVCALFDARRKELYGALFTWKHDRFVRDIPENVMSPAKWAGILSRYERVVLTGEGAVLYKASLTNLLGERAVLAPPDKLYPSPANIAFLGRKMAENGDFSDPVALVPFYIRKAEAETKNP
jgi:tRNA threonylcarbamoyladenosine biosynthesis protein TsaB